ncbi:MAG: IS21 family transposase [Longimicrobiales bacterium]|jgi:transposase
MIDYGVYCQIRSLHEQQKLSVRQISRRLKLDKKTVRKWLVQPFVAPKRPGRASKLDPYKERIKSWVEQDDLSAQQVLQRLESQGFTGRYSIVRDYVRLVRPKPLKAYLTLRFAPGECMQVDWGSWGHIPVGSTRRQLSFFAAVLCHSRMLYVEFTLGQSQEHFLSCHENAFAYFEGCSESVMVDNCKTAVLSHPRGQEARINPRYLDFANHNGFKVRACGARQPQEKGRVEHAVGYIKNNFLRGLELPPWPALNLAARHWLETVANVRLHGVTHKTPLELFEAEKLQLKARPAHPYDVATVRQVSVNSRFRVTLDTNRYSVPARLAGAPLTLKLYPARLVLVHQGQIVAEHERCFDRHKDLEHPEHAQPLLDQRRKARTQKLLACFLTLCPEAPLYHERLQGRRLNANHHVQKIMALVEVYGSEAVARAVSDAHEYRAYSCEYIANILEQRLRKLPEPGALHLTRASDLLDLEIPEPDLSVYDDDDTDNTDDDNPTPNQSPSHE